MIYAILMAGGMGTRLKVPCEKPLFKLHDKPLINDTLAMHYPRGDAMRKNGDTKAAMAEALRTCMEHASIDRISIKAITDLCGLNRQTFYYHFRDIYDLAKWMYVHDINEAMDKVQPEESAEEQIRAVLLAFDRDAECHLEQT